MPTLSPREAYAALQGIGIERVLSWVEVLRTVNLDVGRPHTHRCVTSQQLNALRAIEGLPDDQIMALLSLDGHTARSGSSHSSFDWSPTGDSSTPNSQQNSIEPIYRSSAGTLLIPPTPTRSSGPKTPRSPSSRENSFLGHSREQSIDERTSISSVSNTPSHSHWCTVCKDHKAISTCDGWKRHMKEHETCYPCLRCGHPSTLGKDKKFTRKSNLVNHLQESHNVSDKQSALASAEQWKRTEPKKAYACGFCVKHSGTLQDQMNHIDNLHFKHSQDMTGWDHNNVILGLLAQPDVKVAWQKQQASNRPSINKYTWPYSVVADVQTMLEMCQDSPDALAAEVLKSTDQYRMLAEETQSTSTLDPMDQDMATDHSFMAQPQYQAARDFTPTSSYYNGMQPSNHSYPAETLPSTSQTMMTGHRLEPSHARSLSSAMSDPFIDGPSMNAHQPDLMHPPDIMNAYQDSASIQPSPAPANTGNINNTPFAFSTSENNNFLGIGTWQDPDTSDDPPTASANEIFGYRDYQSNHSEVPEPAMETAFTSTNNVFNPQNNASDRWQNFSYPNTANNISLSTSQDDDESHARNGYNYRTRYKPT
ncbi:hypothetical protein JMJ35_010307 [Cladonia borealis]|uniref:C2H2-type domain-containing protein n=1 Tax=Cladonia borealis TaxID=184061 RepID=A0AA39V1H2_9LECA|nr:hypothetical protein JMJ35_010307 [Cladonia borealis]